MERLSDGQLPAFTSFGCYTLIYLTRANDVLCADCATAALDDPDEDDKPVICGTYDEGPPETCANCNKQIESSYGDPDETEGSDQA
jgi:hypothetical protein